MVDIRIYSMFLSTMIFQSANITHLFILEKKKKWITHKKFL
jgi:hypothetical protein